MGEKPPLGRPPDDYQIYKFAWEFRRLPDEIRAMAVDDFNWMIILPTVQRLADEELARRGK